MEFSIKENLLEKNLHEIIDQCISVLQYVHCTIEWSVKSVNHEVDGVTIINGWFRILDKNGNTVTESNVSCATMRYILYDDHIDADLCLRSCISNIVISYFKTS